MMLAIGIVVGVVVSAVAVVALLGWAARDVIRRQPR